MKDHLLMSMQMILMHWMISIWAAQSFTAEKAKKMVACSSSRQKKQIRAKDIVGAIANEAGIPGKTLGEIAILMNTPCGCAERICQRYFAWHEARKNQGQAGAYRNRKKEKTYGKRENDKKKNGAYLLEKHRSLFYSCKPVFSAYSLKSAFHSALIAASSLWSGKAYCASSQAPSQPESLIVPVRFMCP